MGFIEPNIGDVIYRGFCWFVFNTEIKVNIVYNKYYIGNKIGNYKNPINFLFFFMF